jgi:hypothetical protein
MKTRCLLFLLFLILITLPGLISLVVTSEAAGETDQSKNIKDPEQYNRLVEIAEDVLTRLHKGPLQNRKDAPQAVTKGLIILHELLETDKNHAQELGFLIDKGTIEENLMGAQLRIYPVFEIHLDDLRAFSQGSDVNQLLFYTDQLLLSIGTRKQAQTSLTIRLTDNEQYGTEQKRGTITWRPTRWGRSNLIHQLTEAQNQPATQNKPAFLVSIPSFNKNFLGYKDKTVIKLVPLANDHLLKEGESYLAEDVFTWLSAEAKSVDDSPR